MRSVPSTGVEHVSKEGPVQRTRRHQGSIRDGPSASAKSGFAVESVFKRGRGGDAAQSSQAPATFAIQGRRQTITRQIHLVIVPCQIRYRTESA